MINIIALVLRASYNEPHFQRYSPFYLLLVVGDAGAGKTTAIRKLIGRPFPTRVVPTVAYQFYSGSISVAGKEIRLHFWDISGQKSRSALGMSFAGDVDAVVIVYDLTSFASFHSATRWLHDLYQIKKFPVLLFGNKLDLCYNNKGREVNGQESELLKKMEGISKVGSGLVDRVFEGGLIELVQKYLVTDIIFQSEENVSSCCCR